MAIVNPNQNPTLAPGNDNVAYASTTPSAHTWYATYTNNTGATQTVTVSIPMGALETTRSFTSADTGVTGNSASGAAGVYEALTVTAGGTVTYTIASTYTLASGESYGSNTNRVTWAVTSGSTYKRFQVVLVGTGNAATYQLFPQQTREARDSVAIMDYLLTRGLDLMEAQELYDWLENSAVDVSLLAIVKGASGLGNHQAVSTAVDYVVRPQDFFILETGNSKTVTAPRPELYSGRTMWVRDTGTGGVLDWGAGSLNGGATGATFALTQSKTFGFFSNGSTWLTLAVQA